MGAIPIWQTRHRSSSPFGPPAKQKTVLTVSLKITCKLVFQATLLMRLMDLVLFVFTLCDHFDQPQYLPSKSTTRFVTAQNAKHKHLRPKREVAEAW